MLLALFLFLGVASGCGDTHVESADHDHEKKGDTSAKVAKEEEHDHEHEEEGEGHDHHEEGEAGEVEMTPAMMKDAGITVEPVMKQPVSATVSAPGRVVPTQNGVAHVGTVIAGRVTRLYVSEGSHVRKGAPLAEIEAFDIGSLKGEYATARATMEHTTSALARQEKLASEGIGAQRSLEEARAAHGQAVAAVRASEAKLRAVGIDPASVRSSGAFTSHVQLRSPISGVVARRAVVLGEYIEPSKDAFEVVNTSTVWIDAQVSPDVAATLSVGRAGFVRDRSDHRHVGSIRFISPTVNAESRTVTVRVEVSNPDVHMRPESFVSVEFERSVSGTALSVPKGAIEQEGAELYVYLEHEPGHFQRVAIEAGPESGERRVVTAGLKEGDRVATAGIFYLKSARQKGELQEHHH
jgi:membrane fusion protein, heavy metal efflux system